MPEPVFLDSLFTEELYLLPSRVWIVITKPWNDLTPNEKEQLTKIADALRSRINRKLNLEAFTVIHMPSLDLSQLRDKPQHLVYFGPIVSGLQQYELIEAGGVRMVLAEGLSELTANESSRSKLWTALKKLFPV
jgi:hypothetical protein